MPVQGHGHPLWLRVDLAPPALGRVLRAHDDKIAFDVGARYS